METNHGVESSGGGEIIVSGPSPFDNFPEDCISKIISFTSPRDACVVASVSQTFESAVKSDIVWEKFLPEDYPYLVPQWRDFSSKKELYFALCDDPVLIDNGRKSLWLEKASGKKCIMLSATDLIIKDANNPYYWVWITIHESSFESVARLQNAHWFEVCGRMNTRVLSPRTCYMVYIVFEKCDQCVGFDDMPIEARVEMVGQRGPTRFICFDSAADGSGKKLGWTYSEERKDVWMEVELGEFFHEGGLIDGNEVEISIFETHWLDWKCGLIIQGFEIRPS